MNTKVLLADTEEQFTSLLAQRLQARGFDVITANFAEDVVALVKRKDVDVVILDVMIPGIDGLDTLREIKRLRPLAQVIMLTVDATVYKGIQAMKLGAYDYLTKPTDTGELVEKIAKAHKSKHEQKRS
jgi:two-component system, OmpR family, response regulator CpxR